MKLRIQRQDSGAVAVLAVYGELDLDGGRSAGKHCSKQTTTTTA